MQENLRELRESVNMPVLPISAKLGTNIPELLTYLRTLYDAHRPPRPTVKGRGRTRGRRNGRGACEDCDLLNRNCYVICWCAVELPSLLAL